MDTSAKAVRFDDDSMWVELSDGRTIGVPFAWFPRLLNASKREREAVEIGRFGLHWDAIDEDISIAGLLAGRRDRTARPKAASRRGAVEVATLPRMANLSILPAPHPTEDITIFASHCVFMRSIYLREKTLFEFSSADDKDRMLQAARIFFGNLNRMFIEYVILQVCKITDPAQDNRRNDNHTVAFLLEHYDFSADPYRKETSR